MEDVKLDTNDNIKNVGAINLKKAWKLSKSWKNAAIIWRTLDHLFVVGAFAASVSVIFISTEANKGQIAVVALSSIAAILTLIGFACNPTKYMTNYRTAFQILITALVSNTNYKGEFTGGDKGWEEIISAIKQGEKYIGRTYDVNFDEDEET